MWTRRDRGESTCETDGGAKRADLNRLPIELVELSRGDELGEVWCSGLRPSRRKPGYSACHRPGNTHLTRRLRSPVQEHHRCEQIECEVAAYPTDRDSPLERKHFPPPV